MKSTKKKVLFIPPADLLAEARKLTKLNQTDTLVLALNELIRSYKRKSIFKLKGKLNIEFDVEKSRQRSRF